MKNQYTFIGFVAIFLLVTLSHGGALPDHGIILRDDDDRPSIESNTIALNTNEETSTNTATSSLTTTTTTTTAQTPTGETTANPTVTSTTPSANNSTEPITTTTLPTTSTTTTETTVSTTTTAEPPTTTTTIPPSTTTAAPGRKFDGLSFMGGIILTVGLGALAYLVVRYLRRTNRLPYSNLR